MPLHRTKNDQFFTTWTHEMAYVLGFFAADGSMIKNNRGAHYIEFHVADGEILKKIRRVLGSTHSISHRKQRQSWKKDYRLQIGSKRMYDDLLALKMTKTKSKTLQMPDVPKQYIADFVRGYFDGDGNVYVWKRLRKGNLKKQDAILTAFTCGNKSFLECFHAKLVELQIVGGGSIFSRESYFRLNYSVRDSCKLYKFMYNTPCELYIERKKAVFDTYFSDQ